jgi:pyruvate dehydrogenase E1 component alpha subunit
VGAAESFAMQGKTNIAVAFMGEGAANQGAFHEALNLAAVWKSPVVFVIEDNGYGISSAKKNCTAVERNTERAAGYGMKATYVGDNDPDAIYAAAGDAVARARSGQGPTLIEIKTTRLEGHFVGDQEGYRPTGEVAALTARDPIPAYRARLIADDVAARQLDDVESAVRREIDAAFTLARGQALPAAAEALRHVFVERRSA